MISIKRSKVVTEKSYKDRENNYITNVEMGTEVRLFGILVHKQKYNEALTSVPVTEDEEGGASKKKIGFTK